MLSLLARASVAPASSAAIVARSPAAPTMPLSTVRGTPAAAAFAAARETSSCTPASPASTSSSGARAAASAAAFAPRRHTSLTPWSAACSSSRPTLEPAARPTRSQPGTAASTSSACRPIEPVDPRITRRLGPSRSRQSDPSLHRLLAIVRGHRGVGRLRRLGGALLSLPHHVEKQELEQHQQLSLIHI